MNLSKLTKVKIRDIWKAEDRDFTPWLVENISRSIPDKLTANIDLSRIRVTKIFKWIRKKNISESEMLKTFNCGVGFCLIAERKKISIIKKLFKKKYKPYEIGFVSKSSKKIRLFNKVKW